MNILIVYGTSEGHTRKICEHVAERLTAAGHSTSVKDSARPLAGVQPTDFDGAVVAGSVHQQRHQDSLRLFVAAHREQLAAIPTLLISVSLSAAFKLGRKDAEGYLSDFLDQTGWTPGRSLLVAGALRFSKYDYFMQQIVEHVVMAHRELGEKTNDYDFTDWEALDAAVDEFVASVGS